ncbi:hypothetical protein CDL15_Pgr015812 [Punica granatum]|uniref:TIR domain-containing protein n=1 Tax=Punica granatum TaxID=22663 RepID=A0A218XQ52_PUNGR|nr:hypothetical protein CDL15_Pgr015812 [Punica granatum]
MEIGGTSSEVGGSDYQVFLSFRGTDTRQGFSDTLYHYLKDAGITVFKDSEEQPLGEKIQKILDAIDCSSICIPIFSRNYASSKWCLRELARMVELDKKIIPVFYDVMPDDVTLQTKLYADALEEHSRKFMVGKGQESRAYAWEESASEVPQWEEALRKVGTLAGWNLRDTGHGEFCNSVTKEIVIRLNVKQKIVPDHLVGMDDQVKAVLGLLDVEAYDVRYVGIHGMGGIGKTTLAKVVFNELSPHFDGCSFLSDIRESWKQDGVKYLQKQLLSDLQDGNKLWMHDVLRELGREIVQKENFKDPGRRSRLWMHEEALGTLEGEEGTEVVQAMRMSNDEQLTGHCFGKEAFKGLKNLRFLEWYRLSFDGDFSRLLKSLRWLSWHSCPEDFTATNLNLQNLVILDLSWSGISEQWDGWSRIKMGHLKVLDLTGCKNLTKSPDFSKYTTLERLILADCEALTEIDRSVGKLKRLKHLNVKGCDSLRGLPEELGSLDDLEEIFVGGKRKSFTLPEIIGNLKSLIILEIFNVQITNGLPSSLCRLNNLKRLALIGCSGIERLPDSLGDLESLIELDISYSAISELPDSIGNLRELKVMVMTQSKISTLPGTIGMLKKLEVLHAGGTLLMGALPREMESLSRLKVLDLSNTRILELFSVSKLSLLQTLDLEKCHQLRELPELPKSLVSLHVSSRSLQKLPDLSELHNLVDLKLYDANDDWALGLVLAKVGAYRLNESFSFDALMNADGECSDNIEWVQKMSNLVTLELSLRNFTNLPTDFRALTRLKALELSCPHMSSPPQLPFTLSRLILGHLVVKQNLPDLSHLKNLSYLRFYNCLIVDGFFRIGIKELHSLNALMIDCCEIYDLCGCCLPENLRSISIYWCHSLRLFIMLSSLKKLKHLHLWECSNLCMLQGLGEVESLQWLEINGCHTLERLEDLSKLQKLEVLEVEDCDSLVDVKGEGGIKATQDLIDERQFAETPGELRVIGGHSQHSLQISTQSLDSLRDLSLTDIYKFWT